MGFELETDFADEADCAHGKDWVAAGFEQTGQVNNHCGLRALRAAAAEVSLLAGLPSASGTVTFRASDDSVLRIAFH